ncbi:MAG: SAM-dependent chlorinase/fluorinase [Chloroflexi bacterium]|nr:SAM-dependent chlorinase/fluorinase [Chloroflexota bacterium]
MSLIITLLTDFGLEDSYVAEVKGVLLSLAPEATLVDITHLVPPQDALRGALVLAAAFHRFPLGTVHLAVVDPGVGTARRAIAVAASGYHFVGPDNGLLSLALDRLGALGKRRPPRVEPLGGPRLGTRPLRGGARVVELAEPRFWLPAVSSTFHGRDIFAPVAAHLAQGVPLEEMGRPIASLLAFPFPRPERAPEGTLRGHVVAVDRFGNMMTDLQAQDLPSAGSDMEVEIAGRRIVGLQQSYGEEGLIALIASAGYLEIAVVNGNAAHTLAAGAGAEVIVRPRS